MNTEDWATVAITMKERRKALDNLTQEEAARRADVGIQTWRNLEAGKAGVHRDATLEACDRALGWRPGTIRRIAETASEIETPTDSIEVEVRLRQVESEIHRLRTYIEQFVTQFATQAQALWTDAQRSEPDNW